MFDERYKLSEKELISFLQGKSLIFFQIGLFRIEVVPPNHGITIDYKTWDTIKSYLFQLNLPFDDIERIIDSIEKRENKNEM